MVEAPCRAEPSGFSKTVGRTVSVALIFLAACGGGGGTASREPAAQPPQETKTQGTAPLADPCTLLTAADAEAALGGPVGEPDRFDSPGFRSPEPVLRKCSYEVAGKDLFLIITIARVLGGETVEAYKTSRATYEDVPAVGDRAIYSPERGELIVSQGSLILIIIDTLAKSNLERLKAHGAKALGRL